ncbi:MAG: CPBP family glutamic-type intramembrane protease [Luteolibacter sp.]
MNTAPRNEQEARALTTAHVAPLAVFLGFMLLLQVVGAAITWKHPDAPWWRRAPEHWMYPLQTLVVLGLLLRGWKYYEFRWSAKGVLAGIACGAIGIGLWLLPTTLYDRLGLDADPEGWRAWLGVAARKEGFDPGVFQSPAAWWTVVVLRFFRAVVVVALAEEIFWRGFMMRFLLTMIPTVSTSPSVWVRRLMRLVPDWKGEWWQQPFGKPSWVSYLVVTGLFTGVHMGPDRAMAFLYGSITYLLCIRSKSLGACVAMHATANLLMCLYIVAYGKYGLW